MLHSRLAAGGGNNIKRVKLVKVALVLFWDNFGGVGRKKIKREHIKDQLVAVQEPY